MEECGNDLDAAIKRLNELHLGYREENAVSAEEPNDIVEKGMLSPFWLYLVSFCRNFQENPSFLLAIIIWYNSSCDSLDRTLLIMCGVCNSIHGYLWFVHSIFCRYIVV